MIFLARLSQAKNFKTVELLAGAGANVNLVFESHWGRCWVPAKRESI